MQGYKVAVAEHRSLVGGAAVTEEIFPGYRFSRASDLVGLLRQRIVEDLKLEEKGFQILTRNPSRFTPLRDGSKYLLLGQDETFNAAEIAKFSRRDAKKFPLFEAKMKRIATAVEPLLDEPPIDFFSAGFHSPFAMMDKLRSLTTATRLGSRLAWLGRESLDLLELLTSPASKILSREFESEPLRGMLARSAVSGSATGPAQPGSSLLLLRHMLGCSDGVYGQWSHVRGGMGTLSESIATAAKDAGAEIFLETPVASIIIDSKGFAAGGELEDGRRLYSRCVISNADPRHTFLGLCSEGTLPSDFIDEIRALDFRSSTFKINVALSGLPTFNALKRDKSANGGPEHNCSIYLGPESIEAIHSAYLDAEVNGRPSSNPIVEINIPSVLDPTLAPPGHHIASLTVQYAPHDLPWSDARYKKAFVERIFSLVDDYASDFSKLIVDYDALSPQDLEVVFSLSLGNSYHGNMTPDQLYNLRPTKRFSRYRSPLPMLYLCGVGTHPGGKAVPSSLP